MNGLKKYWCISAISLAAIVFLVGILFVKNPGSAGQFASNYFGAGEFARGVFASGEFGAGIFVAGPFAVGVFSIGIFSAGLFSVGLYGFGHFVLAKYRKPLQIATAARESGSEGRAGTDDSLGAQIRRRPVAANAQLAVSSAIPPSECERKGSTGL